MSHWYGFKIDYIMDRMTLKQVIIYYGNIPQEGILQKEAQKNTEVAEKAKLRAFIGGAKVKHG